MKKICYVTTVHSTLESFVMPVVKQLQTLTDWEITVICNADETFAATLPEGVRYIPVAMKRGISLGGIAAIGKLRRIFRKEKFDLVQYSTPNASLYASLAAWLARVPVRLYCQWGIAYVGFSGMKRKVFKTVEKLVCRLSTWVEPDSFGNLHFSHAEKLYPQEKGSVIWNGSASGIDLLKFDIAQKAVWRQDIRRQWQIPDDAFVYGFVGRITGDKGINELFAAFQKLLQTKPTARLLLVGKEEKIETLEPALYAWAQQEPRVLFCGYSNTVEQYLAAMDVYLLPSYREGFGSGVIEAEAMGVPVIVSDIPGPTDAMQRDVTGLVVPAMDADALEQAMQTMAQDEQLLRRLGAAAVGFAGDGFEQKQLCEYILADRKRLLGETE